MRWFIPAFLLVTLVAWAQEPCSKTMVVTADRIEEPAEAAGTSTTVITREEIEERKVPFVLDLLRTVPGVQVLQSGSVGKPATVFLWGASPDQTLIMIDGVQINDSRGFVDLGNLRTTGVERIEIVRGAQSTLYGSDAMGGVINILTRNAGPLISAQAEIGSHDTRIWNFRAGVGSNKNNIALYSSRYDTDGEITNDDYRNTTKGINFHVEIFPGTNFGWILRAAKTSLGIPLTAGMLPPLRRTDTDSTLLILPLTQRINDTWTVEARFSLFKQASHFRDPQVPFRLIPFDSSSRTTSVLLQSTWKTPMGDPFIVGYEHEQVEVDSLTNHSSPLSVDDYTTDSGYAQLQLSDFEPFSFAIGLRHDKNNVYGSKTSPRLTVSVHATTALRLHGSVGTGFRGPRPLELAPPFGNPALKPEKVKSWDLGAEYEVIQGRLLASTSVFSNDYDDLIAFDLQTSTLRNFRSVKASGAEVEAEYHPFEHFTFLAMYTYLKTRDRTSDEPLPGRAENSGNLTIGYQWKKAGITYNWNFVGGRFGYSDVTLDRVQNEAFQRADLTLDYNVVEPLQIYCRITNLFDRRTQEVFPSPDRGIFAGLQFQYKSP